MAWNWVLQRENGEVREREKQIDRERKKEGETQVKRLSLLLHYTSCALHTHLMAYFLQKYAYVRTEV